MRKCTGNNTQEWGFDAIFVLNLKDQKTDFTGTILHNLSVQVTVRAGPFSVDSG
jgi:hypothetical protein